MNSIKYFSYLVFILVIFTSCDPEHCRNCEEFNTDITNWRNDIEDTTSIIEFVGQSKEIQFQLDSVIINKPFTYCEISSTVKGVTCNTNKKYVYSIPALNLNYTEDFQNYKDGFSEKFFVNYNFNNALSDTIYQSGVFFIGDSTIFHMQFEKSDILSHFGITYQNIVKLNMDQVYNTLEKVNEPSPFFTAFYFKEGFGVVAFTTLDNEIYIRKR
jgi:hypothetical protein